MGKVKVSIGPAGGTPLQRVFDASELEGKSVETIVRGMVDENWHGKDLAACDGVRSELAASHGYEIKLRTKDPMIGTRDEPVSLRAPAREYEQDVGEEHPVIDLDIVGYEGVGNIN